MESLETTDREVAVFAVHLSFGGGSTTRTKYVRATSKQRAKWWAREQYEKGVVRWVSRREDSDTDDVEIHDVGGWDDR